VPSAPTYPADYPGLTRTDCGCNRRGKTEDRLLPWEQRLMSLVTGLGEDYLRQIRLHFVPPQSVSEAGGIVESSAIQGALSRGYNITMGQDIWFVGPINTCTESDLLLLAHESAHVRQFADWGKDQFLQAYILEWMGHGFSYPDILAERKANLAEDSLREFLGNHLSLLRTVQSCGDISDELLRHARAYLDEYNGILTRRALTGAYGDDLKQRATSL